MTSKGLNGEPASPFSFSDKIVGMILSYGVLMYLGPQMDEAGEGAPERFHSGESTLRPTPDVAVRRVRGDSCGYGAKRDIPVQGG